MIFADTPLITPQTLSRMRTALAEGAAIAVLGFRPADPTGYGRLVMEGERPSSPFARNSTRRRPSARSVCATAA